MTHSAFAARILVVDDHEQSGQRRGARLDAFGFEIIQVTGGERALGRPRAPASAA